MRQIGITNLFKFSDGCVLFAQRGARCRLLGWVFLWLGVTPVWAVYDIYDLGEVQWKGTINDCNSNAPIDGPQAINDKGVIAGILQDRLIIWDGPIVNTNVSIAAVDLGAQKISVSDIDNAGNVIGMTYVAENIPMAFFAQGPNLELATIDTLNIGMNDVMSNAFGMATVNGVMTIVGSVSVGYSSHDPKRAVMWSGVDGPIELDNLLGFKYTDARSINTSGIIVGTGIPENNLSRAVLWDAGAVDISRGRAKDINAAGMVVGVTREGSRFGDIGFVLDSATMQPIINLPVSGVKLNFKLSFTQAINNQGLIIGSASASDRFCNPVAVIWRPDVDGNYIDIEALADQIPPNSGWRLYTALDINDVVSLIGDDGQIVGIGRFNGIPSGFLLSPAGVNLPIPRAPPTQSSPAGGGNASDNDGTAAGTGDLGSPSSRSGTPRSRGGGANSCIELAMLLFLLIGRRNVLTYQRLHCRLSNVA